MSQWSSALTEPRPSAALARRGMVVPGDGKRRSVDRTHAALLEGRGRSRSHRVHVADGLCGFGIGGSFHQCGLQCQQDLEYQQFHAEHSSGESFELAGTRGSPREARIFLLHAAGEQEDRAVGMLVEHPAPCKTGAEQEIWSGQSHLSNTFQEGYSREPPQA